MNTINYIPHSLIKDIYPRIDLNNQPYLRIRLNDGKEYDTIAGDSHIKTDANGISGYFVLQ